MSKVISFTDKGDSKAAKRKSDLLKKKLIELGQTDFSDLSDNVNDQILTMSITKNDIDFINSIRDTLPFIPKEEKRVYGTMLIAILARHIGTAIASFSESDLDVDVMLNSCNNYIYKQMIKGETYE